MLNPKGLSLLKLSNHQISKLQYPEFIELIEADILPYSKALLLNRAENRILLSKIVRSLLIQGHLDLKKALVLTDSEVELLEIDEVQDLIEHQLISIERAINLNWSEQEKISSPEIVQMIKKNKITIEQVFKLDLEQISTLEYQKVYIGIMDNVFSIETVLSMTERELNIVSSKKIQALLKNRIFNLDALFNLSDVQKSIIKEPGIYSLLLNRFISLDEAFFLSEEDRDIINSPGVSELLLKGILTREQAINLSYAQLQLITEPNIRQRILNREINFIQIIEQSNGLLNKEQSTHNSTVHKDVSTSALKLKARYGKYTLPEIIQDVFIQIDAFISSLPKDSLKHQAAARCLHRLLNPEYQYLDPDSQISTQTLLALSFLAIHDDARRMGPLKDALNCFIDGLYETQRGYNILSNQEDLGGNDLPICKAGTFNKLIEKLQSLHKDIQVRYLSKTTATLKFQKVVKAKALSFIGQYAYPKCILKLRQFFFLIENLKKTGIELIYPQIRDKIEKDMFDEFGPLYTNKQDPNFQNMIDQGIYYNLEDLTQFQGNIQSSRGYKLHFHMYLEHKLKRQPLSGFNHNHSLWLFRHTHPKLQQLFDKQCGLTVREQDLKCTHKA